MVHLAETTFRYSTRNRLHGQRRYRFPSTAIECTGAAAFLELTFCHTTGIPSFRLFRHPREGHGRIRRGIGGARLIETARENRMGNRALCAFAISHGQTRGRDKARTEKRER